MSRKWRTAIAPIGSGLVLCGAVALAVRGHFTSDELSFTRAEPNNRAVTFGATSSAGRLSFDRTETTNDYLRVGGSQGAGGWIWNTIPASFHVDSWASQPGKWVWGGTVYGFSLGHVQWDLSDFDLFPPPRFNAFGVAVPLWAIILAASVILVVGITRRARRASPGGLTCRQCGYDLRASPSRCPECGLTVPAI